MDTNTENINIPGSESNLPKARRLYYSNRVFIALTTFIIGLVLAFNVILIKSQDSQSNTSAKAAPQGELTNVTLPVLPTGCEYKKAGQEGYTIVCGVVKPTIQTPSPSSPQKRSTGDKRNTKIFLNNAFPTHPQSNN
jgi:hypothetical protein